MENDAVPTAVVRWNEQFEGLNWKEIFNLCFKFDDIKLRWFEARVLHRLIPTRKFLYDRKIVDDPHCNSCNQDIQTVQHLFWRCEKLRDFWNELERSIKICGQCDTFCFSEELVLFGCKSNVITNDVFDFILVLAKYYIYICSRKNRTPNFFAFLNIIKLRYSDLKFLARINGTHQQFANNWASYQTLLL